MFVIFSCMNFKTLEKYFKYFLLTIVSFGLIFLIYIKSTETVNAKNDILEEDFDAEVISKKRKSDKYIYVYVNNSYAKNTLLNGYVISKAYDILEIGDSIFKKKGETIYRIKKNNTDSIIEIRITINE